MSKILVISPHPDDDVIGCGGTIAKHIKKKDSVIVAIVSYFGSREREAVKVAKLLKYEVTFLRLKEPILYNEKNLRAFIKLIRKFSPDIVYSPHKKEKDRDHRNCNDIISEALWMAGVDVYLEEGAKLKKEIFAFLEYEVWTPFEDFNFCVDISDFIKLKESAINIHLSQTSDRDYASGIIGLNKYRAVMKKCGSYAEVFNIRWIKSQILF